LLSIAFVDSYDPGNYVIISILGHFVSVLSDGILAPAISDGNVVHFIDL